MRLAVSNIAWDRSEDDRVAEALRREGVTGIEIAPTKWRDDPLRAPAADIEGLRREWNDQGLRIVSLQALLFGRPDLQLFGSDASRAAMFGHLERTVDFAAAVGAHALVFGSPGNRKRGSMSLANATSVAVDFLQKLGAYAHDRGTTVSLEANPVEYGCDFVTTTADAVALCNAVGHPGIGVNGDLGGIMLAGEDPVSALESAASRLVHVHASEPALAELSVRDEHIAAGRALSKMRYDGWVSIEMRAVGGGQNVSAVERAVKAAKTAYVQSVPTESPGGIVP